MPTLKEICYSAGLFDGEGSVSAYLQTSGRSERKVPGLVVQLASTDKKVINWLISTWQAGWVISSKRDRPNHRLCYHWKLYGDNAKRFLEAVLPYLIIKREVAGLGISLRDRMKQGGTWRYIPSAELERRMQIRDKILTLNVKHKSKARSKAEIERSRISRTKTK